MMAVVAERQEHPAFQVLERSLELDGSTSCSPTRTTGDILAKHGPSWTKTLHANRHREPDSSMIRVHEHPAREDLELSWLGKPLRPLEDKPEPAFRLW